MSSESLAQTVSPQVSNQASYAVGSKGVMQALDGNLLWVEVPYNETNRADGILALLPHNAIDQENLQSRVRFGVYLSEPVTEEICQGLAQLLNAYAWRIEKVPVKDWVAETQAGLPPVQAGRFTMHGSHDEACAVVPSGSYGLLIDAATAFGTGHHGSTKGCLLMYSRLLKQIRPKRTLDVGTGSGVLAIAAAKAQRQRVDATDYDPEAVRVTVENCRLNGVNHWVKTWVSDGYDQVNARYDLIFANILAQPLARLAPPARKHLEPGGYTIMAGLQDWQKAVVVNAYRKQGFHLVDHLLIGRWMTLLMRRGH